MKTFYTTGTMTWIRIRNIFLTLFLATLTACILYPFIQSALHNWTSLDYPPARVFRRIWMISVLLALILARKPLGMKHPAQVGFSFSLDSLRNMVIGLLCVFLFLSTLSVLYFSMGAWETPAQLNTALLKKRLVQGFIRGALVSGIEEYVFRGLIFFSLCRVWPWMKSAIVTSIIFSSLHFLEGRGQEAFVAANYFVSGFQLCGLLLSNMAHHFTWFPDALGLFIVGMALCHAAHHTGSLWYGAGLHGGWIWYFTFRSTLFVTTGSIQPLWIGGNRLFNGILPMMAILLIFPVTLWLKNKNVLKQSLHGI